MFVADELIENIVNLAQIPSQKRRQEVQRELRSHIEDFIFAAREAGRDDDEIEGMLLANFGDPAQIARGFAWVYRHERRLLRAFVFVLSTMVLASFLSAAILTMQAGVAFGFGIPILNVLASRHTAIEALDILSSVAAYVGFTSLEQLFDGQRFQKAAGLLTLILTISIALCAAAGVHKAFLIFGFVNGVFFRAIQVFIRRRMARIAIVVACFALAGLVSSLLWSPALQFAGAVNCTSWLIMGAGYQLMTDLSARVDTALFDSLQRIRAGR
jgi:hypothetical protein